MVPLLPRPLLGADAPLDLIGLRLRCARCGQTPCDAWFDWQADQDDAAPDDRHGDWDLGE